jgi:hypothetical protein
LAVRPSRLAIFGIDTAGKPLSSASSTATATIPSTVCAGFGPRRAAGSAPQARASPGGRSVVGVDWAMRTRYRYGLELFMAYTDSLAACSRDRGVDGSVDASRGGRSVGGPGPEPGRHGSSLVARRASSALAEPAPARFRAHCRLKCGPVAIGSAIAPPRDAPAGMGVVLTIGGRCGAA